jgi:hypothetical protein
MEVVSSVATIFENLKDDNGFVVIKGIDMYKYMTEELEDLIDNMGEQSKKQRGQKHADTSSVKVNKDQLLYIKIINNGRNDNKLAAFAKVQKHKKFFKLDRFGGVSTGSQTTSSAILDFYVHPSFEPLGYKQELLSHILKVENSHPRIVDMTGPAIKYLETDHHDIIKSPRRLETNKYATINNSSSQGILEEVRSRNSPNEIQGRDILNYNTQEIVKNNASTDVRRQREGLGEVSHQREGLDDVRHQREAIDDVRHQRERSPDVIYQREVSPNLRYQNKGLDSLDNAIEEHKFDTYRYVS